MDVCVGRYNKERGSQQDGFKQRYVWNANVDTKEQCQEAIQSQDTQPKLF